jgi:LuxR family maltose regulon positive regulatory protein
MDLHISTKLSIPPTRANLLARPHLYRQLNRLRHHKLLLVSAPAGFGKTTLLSAWCGQSVWPVAWVSLDAADNDPVRFWSYVTAALATFDATIDQHILPLIRAPRPSPVDQLIPMLVDAATRIPDHVVIVLDDYHGIEAGAIHASLTNLLDYLPPTTHLILSSWVDPPLPLARWRARGDLLEVRAADLRLSVAETERLFTQASGLNLSQEDITDLQRRTEGWVAGLHLLALAAEQQPDVVGTTRLQGLGGDHRYIADYLALEVLHQQPEPIRAFLLQTAILDTLNGSLCDAVTERSTSQAILEQLRQRDLFITALNNKGDYRYHQLFADFLRAQLQRHPCYDQQALHLRTADWYEQHGDLGVLCGGRPSPRGGSARLGAAVPRRPGARVRAAGLQR